jgi:hypothetical protein
MHTNDGSELAFQSLAMAQGQTDPNCTWWRRSNQTENHPRGILDLDAADSMGRIIQTA